MMPPTLGYTSTKAGEVPNRERTWTKRNSFIRLIANKLALAENRMDFGGAGGMPPASHMETRVALGNVQARQTLWRWDFRDARQLAERARVITSTSDDGALHAYM
jgi:hypothetical protein